MKINYIVLTLLILLNLSILSNAYLLTKLEPSMPEHCNSWIFGTIRRCKSIGEIYPHWRFFGIGDRYTEVMDGGGEK